MLSNMFMDSSDLEKSNEETSLKMTGLGDNVAKGGDTVSEATSRRHHLRQIQAFSSARRASFPSVTLVDDYRRNCAEAASSRNSARARRCELCQKTTLRHRRAKMASSLGKKIKMESVGVRLSPLNTFQRLVGNTVSERQKESGDVPLQRPFHFESELLAASACFSYATFRSTPEEVFNGKARQIQICVQGKFKEPVPIDDLVFGQFMVRPMVNLPSRWLLALATRVCQSFGAKYTMILSSPSDARPFIRALNISRPSDMRIKTR